MSYTPTVWKTGDLVSSPKLNKIENAIAGLDSTATEVTADVSQLKSEINEVEAGFPQKSASGSIVTIDDGADNVPVVSLTAEINPVQDLHGQDNPYPAGGGPNIYDGVETESSYFNPNSGGITTTGGWWMSGKIPAESSTTYYLYSNSPEASFIVGCWADDENYLGYSLWSAGNKTFTTKEGTTYIRVQHTRSDANKTSINYPSSITSFVPYENICPIVGFTGANVSVTAVNIWNEDWEKGTYNYLNGTKQDSDVNIRSKNLIPVKPSTTYFPVKPSDANIVVCAYDVNGQFVGYLKYSAANTAFTTGAKTHYITFSTIGSPVYGGTFNHDISINYPATDHEYHAHTGRTVNISWETEAGTVYGGTLVLNQDGTADLTVDHAKVNMWELTWQMSSSGQFLSEMESFDGANDPNGQNLICTIYKGGNAYDGAGDNVVCTRVGTYKRIWLVDRACTTATQLGQRLTDTSAQLVYLLATPVTYHITDVELVKTLYGLNNIWADTGDASLTYRADPATFTSEQIRIMLNAMVAPVEATTTASKAYSVNDFLILDNVLYKVISPIANGGTITINTNVSATTVGEQLTAILNS